MKWKIVLMLIFMLSACTTYEDPYSIEREVNQAYSDWQAEQGASDWELEQSAYQNELWSEYQAERYESYENDEFSADSGQIIPSGFADSYVGEYKIVKVSRAYCEFRSDVSEQPTFCNDRPYPNHDFTLLVWGQNWEYLDGACLYVSGKIVMYEGKAQIIATTTSQVEYCE